MKIDPISVINMNKIYRTGKNRAPAPERTDKKIDEAELSAEAMSFSKALSAMRESKETEQATSPEKLEMLADAVKNGEYNVDSGSIADRILAHLSAAAGE